jgi:hypothetical protein
MRRPWLYLLLILLSLPLLALLFPFLLTFLVMFLLFLRSLLIVFLSLILLFLSLILPSNDSLCSLKASDLVGSYKGEYQGLVERIVLRSDGCYDYYRPLEGVKIEDAGKWQLRIDTFQRSSKIGCSGHVRLYNFPVYRPVRVSRPNGERRYEALYIGRGSIEFDVWTSKGKIMISTLTEDEDDYVLEKED